VNNIQKSLAALALLLGIAHIIFGIIVFKSYNLEVVWFIGAGVAMIAVAMTNLSATSLRLRLIQNFMMLLYVIAILGVLQQIQAIIGGLLFGGLFLVSALQFLSKQN